MALTISVTLDDSDVQQFLDLYNQNAGTEITADMLHQNVELQEAVAEDMVQFWFDTISDEDENPAAYDLYQEFFEMRESKNDCDCHVEHHAPEFDKLLSEPYP